MILLIATPAAKWTPEDAQNDEPVSSAVPPDITTHSDSDVYIESEPPAEKAADPEDPPAVSEEPVGEAIDESEVEMLACVIYQEVGGNQYSDKCRYMVGDVVLNRVADDRFPDTMELVLTQERQYGRFYWTGIVWPDIASNPGEAAAVQRAYDTAMALLSGEHSEIYGEGYVWQADFKQGKDIIEIDGMYFGR